MRFTFGVQQTFNAAHRSTLCGNGHHGHDFEVCVEAWNAAGQEPFTDYNDLRQKLASVLGEFNGRDLDDMLVPSQSLDQLCLYIRERLALFFPVTRVSITARPYSVSVEFPLR